MLSNFNICTLSWHSCSETNTKKIEKLQERALGFVYDDHVSTYDELLLRANVPSLRRLRTMALETYKILHNLSPPCLTDLLNFINSKYNFRYTNILQVPAVRTSTYGKSSFRYAAAILWNSFPDSFRQASNFNHFKALISQWNGDACHCSVSLLLSAALCFYVVHLVLS